MRRILALTALAFALALIGGGCQLLLDIGDTTEVTDGDAGPGTFDARGGPGTGDAPVGPGEPDAMVSPGGPDAAPTPDSPVGPGEPDATAGPDAPVGTPDAAPTADARPTPDTRPIPDARPTQDVMPGTAGSIDTSFNGGAVFNTPFGADNYATFGVAVRSDGTVAYFIAGNDVAYDDEGVEQMQPDGSPDTGFGTNGFLSLPGYGGSAIAFDHQGRLIVAGNDNVHHVLLIRLDNQGNRDGSFGTGTGDDKGQVHDTSGFGAIAIAVQPDDGIVYLRSDLSGDFASTLCRITSGGVVDTSFAGVTTGCWKAATSQVDLWGVASDANGAIYAGGRQGSDPHQSPYAVQMSAAGTGVHEVAYTTVSGKQFWATGAATVGGDTVIVGYQSSSAGEVGSVTLAGVSGPDTGFASGLALADLGGSHQTELNAVAVQADGKIVAVGTTSVSGNYAGVVVRYQSNGMLDSGFGSSGVFIDTTADTLSNVAIAPDGRIVVAGATPDERGYVARLWP